MPPFRMCHFYFNSFLAGKGWYRYQTYRPGFSLPGTSLAMAVLSLVLVNWLNWQNRIDLDHQANATIDMMVTLAEAYDHYGFAELQLATPPLIDSQRELSLGEISAFRSHEATPPWLRPAFDDITDSWDVHYLVHYRSGKTHPWMILNFEPQTELGEELTNRIRNGFAGRYNALVSGGTSTVREGMAEEVRTISGSARGSTLTDGQIAFFTWPLADINDNWLPRVERAGVPSGSLNSGLNLGSGHDLEDIGSFTATEMEASGGLSAIGSTKVEVKDLTVTGDGTVVDVDIQGKSNFNDSLTITSLTSTDVVDVADLTGQSSLVLLQGSSEEMDIDGTARVAGDITSPGTLFTVEGDVAADEAFVRTIDSDMNLSLGVLEVRGFYQVDADATIQTVTITGNGTCIGCQF